MAISLASLRTSTVLRPPRVLIHGVAGIGKSTFAASADAPVFVLTEDGLGKLQVPHFPLATSYAEVAEALDALLEEDHAYSTVVVDSVDWLEPYPSGPRPAGAMVGSQSRAPASARATPRR